ncbi:MAG: DUF4268 domain-containing protein [SAR202 cluster bacterium]|nr:DUF4268 domain-containing protein [SAR202 cluster bacterium]MDP6713644.1 DUF4268 domain-containing protein [SAR202 cluster bacterium]
MPKMDLIRFTKMTVADIWADEAQDFTPWLAENLDILGEELGMNISSVETEAPVGSFRLDILARDELGKVTVVIENQLNTTDHNHLGQLLTYAAGYNAETVVWITDGFRDEHRKALDWLNERTNNATRFFGVEVEVFKIAESAPAPHFKVIVSPNDWSKRIKASTNGDLSPRESKYKNYFQQLIDEMREVHHFTNAKIGQPANYYYFSGGHSDIKYAASFVQGNKARVELNIDGEKEKNKQLFDRLKMIQSELETELEEEIAWERLEEARSSRVSVYRPGTIEDADKELDETRAWMVANLLNFKKVFAPRLPDLMK